MQMPASKSEDAKPENTPSANTDPRAVRSREALHRAFLTLLEAKPLEQISIRDIVAEAGIGYTTFFRHHASKEELLDSIAAEQIRCLFKLALPAMDTYDIQSGSRALFAYVDSHRALWRTLLTGGAAATIREEFLNLAREVAASLGNPKSWLAPEAGVALIVGGTLELLTWWLRQSDPISIEHIAEILGRVVVSPVIAAGSDTVPRN
jgi:AcrR family transcriptional regulator